MHLHPSRLHPTFLPFLAFLAFLAFLGFLVPGSSASAGEPWIAPGNTQVRHDVQLLVDSGVIDLPVSAWPIAASDLANALGRISEATSRTPGLAGEGGGQGSANSKPLTAAQLGQ